MAFLCFDGLTALDLVGPFEVLSRLPDANARIVSPSPGIKLISNRMLGIGAPVPLDQCLSPRLLVIPGGPGADWICEEPAVLEWVRHVHSQTLWTAAVCTGALVLGSAGLLEGRRATTHWLAKKALAELGAEVVDERFVVDGKIVTCGGVSAGIDMALWLAGQIAGREQAERIQLAMEYDPQPPFDSGSPEKADPELVAHLRSTSRFR